MRRLLLAAALALWTAAAGAQDVPWMAPSRDGGVFRLTVDQASDGGLEWLLFRHGAMGAWVSLPAANWATNEFDLAAALAANFAAEFARADEEGDPFTHPRTFVFGRWLEPELIADESEPGAFGVLDLLSPLGAGTMSYAYRTHWTAAALHTEHILALIQPLVVQERVAEAAAGDAPEPSIWVLLGIGFASLGYAAYRRKRPAPLAA